MFINIMTSVFYILMCVGVLLVFSVYVLGLFLMLYEIFRVRNKHRKKVNHEKK